MIEATISGRSYAWWVRLILGTAADIFKKRWRLILVIAGIVVTFCFLYALRYVMLPFMCGLVFAYLLLPVISWVEEKLPGGGKWSSYKRVTLIALVFIVILGLIGLIIFYTTVGVVSSFSILLQNAPQYISQGFITLQEWAEGFQRQFPHEMQQQIEQFIIDIAASLSDSARDAFMKGVSYVPATFGLMLGFLSLPIFLFYVLKDSEKLRRVFYSALSTQVAEHTRNIVSIIERVLGRYIRAQLMLGFIVACLCFIGLSILGIELAPALAVFAGIMEFIPILGPWIGGAAGVIVALAVAPEQVIWVALVYLIIQLLENILLVPRIQGAYLRINPAILIVLLVLGAYIAGFWGIILAGPLTATIVQVYRYVSQNMKVEENQQLS